MSDRSSRTVKWRIRPTLRLVLLAAALLVPVYPENRAAWTAPPSDPVDETRPANEPAASEHDQTNEVGWVQAGLFEGIEDDPVKGLRLDSLPRDPTCMAEDQNGALWIGLRMAGIARYAEGELRLFDAYNAQLPDQGIRQILVDKDNVKWFCSLRGKVFKYDDRAEPSRRWNVQPREVIGDERLLQYGGIQFPSIRQHPDGTVWALLSYAGLMKLEDGKMILHPIEALRDEALAMDIDAHGEFWIATRRGIVHGRNAEWKALPDEVFGKGAPRPRVTGDIWCNWKDGAVYFTTSNGLCRYIDGRTEFWTKANHGLLDDRLSLIRGNREGKFVLGYGNITSGVSLFDGTKLHHGVYDGPQTSLDWSGAVISRNGSAYMATRFSGLFAYDGDKLSRVLWRMEDREARKFFNRAPWASRSLKSMIEVDAIDVNLDDVVKQPDKYRNKKIRLVAPTDPEKMRQPIWREHNFELYQFLEKSGWAAKLKNLGTCEYQGYLESGSYFGDRGGYPTQLTIVEIYPHGKEASDAGLRKEDLRGELLKWLDEQLHDRMIAPRPQTAKRVEHRRKLQGKWDLVSSEEAGVLDNDPPACGFIIQWDRLTWNTQYQNKGYLMQIDPDRPVPAVDLFPLGDHQTDQRYGIYQLQGDQLKIHMPNPFLLNRNQVRRPRSFQTSPDDETILLTFRRDPTYQVAKDRGKIKPDPRNWNAPILATRVSTSPDGFGRINRVSFNSSHDSKPVRDEQLLLLKELTNLERLHISSPDVSDAGLKTISEISTLRFLFISEASITDEGLAQLQSLKQLQSLSIRGTTITGKHLDKLASLPDLVELNLSGASIAEENLRHLARWPNLRRLSLSVKLTEDGLKHLRGLNDIEQLSLAGVISETGLVHLNLAGKTRLKQLSIAGSGVTDSGLEGLEKLTNLQGLSFDRTRIGRGTLERIRHCQHLKNLYISSPNITDEDFALLGDMPALQTLNLALYRARSSITGDGLKHFGRLEHLRTLALDGVPLEIAHVEHFKQLKRLRHLSVRRPDLSREVLDELKKALPKALIQ